MPTGEGEKPANEETKSVSRVHRKLVSVVGCRLFPREISVVPGVNANIRSVNLLQVWSFHVCLLKKKILFFKCTFRHKLYGLSKNELSRSIVCGVDRQSSGM